MPGREHGGARGKPGAGGSAPAGPAGAPFDGKIDEIVAKIVPEHLLPTVFAATAVGALIFFIVMFIGFFSGSSDASLQEEVDGLEVTLEEERDKLAKNEEDLSAALDAKVEAEGKVGVSIAKAQEVQGKLTAAIEKQEGLKTQIAGLNGDLKAERGKVRGAEKKLKDAGVQAERDRKAAQKESSASEQKAVKLGADLAKALAKVEELKKQVVAKARAGEALDVIVAGVSAIADPEKKIEEIERLRKESAKELAGTDEMARLDKMIERERDLIEKEKRQAEKKAKLKQKEAYADALARVKKTDDHDAQMAILAEAKAELAGTDYEARVSKQITARETTHGKQVARDVYKKVIEKVQSSPDARAENIRALKVALAQTEGTRYGTALKNLVEALEGK